ncbi:hypothetical protein C5167_000302 [Papaver somniferum]|uniref:Uncharacterized protein n=1 Tax=Papaver somniferum TaxID=3469 RepID=A0A4Y7KUU9_PAPSO|nr:hypothetical protein C5167_000302 [Papaver somniferum]
MDEATEHQNKASNLLGFTIDLKEPERKKWKNKRKVLTTVEENMKKSKGYQGAGAIVIQDGGLTTDVPSVHSYGEDHIILANLQMIRNSIVFYDDPFDMFNDYIIDIPASTPPAVPVNLRTEMVDSAPSNNQDSLNSLT